MSVNGSYTSGREEDRGDKRAGLGWDAERADDGRLHVGFHQRVPGAQAEIFSLSACNRIYGLQ